MNTRPIELGKLRGLLDKAFGLGKEVVGVFTDSDRLQDAGNRQQEKGTASLKALRHQGRAKAQDAKAEVREREERATQRTKSSA
jgi:uncharacterized protein YjbJ (UPF0337 family)